jgi:hypothetical protein
LLRARAPKLHYVRFASDAEREELEVALRELDSEKGIR